MRHVEALGISLSLSLDFFPSTLVSPRDFCPSRTFGSPEVHDVPSLPAKRPNSKLTVTSIIIIIITLVPASRNGDYPARLAYYSPRA